MSAQSNPIYIIELINSPRVYTFNFGTVARRYTDLGQYNKEMPVSDVFLVCRKGSPRAIVTNVMKPPVYELGIRNKGKFKIFVS